MTHFLQVAFQEPRNVTLCLAFCSSVVALSIASVFSLLAVSIDRYLSICQVAFYRNKIGKRVTISAIAFCWIASVYRLSPVLGWNSGVKSLTSCDSRAIYDFNFLIVLGVAFVFTPCLILIVLYTLIYKRIRDQVKLTKCD